MRKALTAIICTIALLGFAFPVFAAEAVDNVFITGLNVGFYGATGWIVKGFLNGRSAGRTKISRAPQGLRDSSGDLA